MKYYIIRSIRTWLSGCFIHADTVHVSKLHPRLRVIFFYAKKRGLYTGFYGSLHTWWSFCTLMWLHFHWWNTSTLSHFCMHLFIRVFCGKDSAMIMYQETILYCCWRVVLLFTFSVTWARMTCKRIAKKRKGKTKDPSLLFSLFWRQILIIVLQGLMHFWLILIGTNSQGLFYFTNKMKPNETIRSHETLFCLSEIAPLMQYY